MITALGRGGGREPSFLPALRLMNAPILDQTDFTQQWEGTEIGNK